MRTGKIYKIVCKTTDKVYIGSTVKRWLCQRICTHIQHYKRYQQGKMNYLKSFDIIENNNFIHELIEEIEFDDISELRQREQYWIERMECINERKAHTNRQEYFRQYRKDHKDDRKGKIKCKCGCEIRQSNISYHLKSKKHHKLMNK